MSLHPYTRLFEKTSAPTVDDDETLGYEVGDVWHHDGGSVYDCRDASTGAAVWEERTDGSEPIALAHIADTTDAHAGTAITNTPDGNISATTTQAAINELDSEKIPTSFLDTDGTLGANSDVKIPSQKAVKTYVDTSVVGLWDAKGPIDCSANPNYPAALKSDVYHVTVAGKIGGASGKSVEVGDVIVCSADNAGGTEASVGTSWYVVEHNLVGAVLAAAANITGTFQLSGIVDATLSSNEDDWTPTGFPNCGILRVTPTNDFSINGLAPGLPGQIVLLHNRNAISSPNLITLTHEAGSSSATYRWALPLDESFTLLSGESTFIHYDGTTARWRVVGRRIITTSIIQSAAQTMGDARYSKLDHFQWNYIINGDFSIWQRGTSFASAPTNTRVADMWKWTQSSAAVVDITRDTDVPTIAQSGHKSNFSLKIDVTTVDASIAAGDFAAIQWAMEGYDYAAIKDQQVTLSFWVKAVKTGIYCVSFRNNGNDRSYIAEYTVNSASTWEKKTITLTLNQSGGTEAYNEALGLSIRWALLSGSTFHTTANAWQNGDYLATSNQVNGADNTSNNIWISQVQLERGSVVNTYHAERFEDVLRSCKRHFQKTFIYATAPAQNAGQEGAFQFQAERAGAVNHQRQWRFEVPMRVEPTITTYNPAAANALPRDIAAGLDFASIATASPTNENNYTFNTTGNAGTAAANGVNVHFSAEAGF